MFAGMGAMEWLIILAIVLLLFGAGRVVRVGRDLGGAIKAFNKGLKENDEVEKEDEESLES